MQTSRESVRAERAGTEGCEPLLAALRERIGTQKFNAWFRHGTSFSVEDGHVRLTVPNPFVANWIETHYYADICEVVEASFGDKTLVISVDPALSADVRKSQRDVQAKLADATQARTRSRPLSQPIKLKHRLEDFVVGQCNRLAYSAAVAMSGPSAMPFNVLFLHGDCGLGKTHLLQGVCNAFAKGRTGAGGAWRYVTAEQFTNEFITAIRHKKIDEFRGRYRNVKLLAIDDIHFISAKKATQDEFLHTFNALETAGSRIVMASDSHPHQVRELNDQLVSRFVSGMVVAVDSPDSATRVEILKRQAARLAVDVEAGVLDFVALHMSGSVRELEGALIKLAAMSALDGKRVTLDMARGALCEQLARTESALTLGQIEQTVSRYFEVTPADLHSSRRTRKVSLARMVSAYLARMHTRMSYPEIGRFMGKNHSSVLLAVGRMEKLLANDDRIEWDSPAGGRSVPARQVVELLSGGMG
jgi:chromosomal replication initiator protein